MKMKTAIATLFFVLAAQYLPAQILYTKAFGDPKHKPVIFLHGGPGYNCANFEATTAQRLADSGFYVIVYDRRGEGRSTDVNAQFTYQQTFDDLNDVYRQYGLKKATLIGHSFGGIIATLYAQKYPQAVDHIVLVAAPVSLQQTFKTILNSSESLYIAKGDSADLKYIHMLRNMDTASIEYASYCFGHAMQNGFYFAKQPGQEAQALYSKFKTDTLLLKYGSQMTYEAPQGFWKNEQYTTADITTPLEQLAAKRIKVYGLYGKDDGLYSAAQVQYLQSIIGGSNLVYYDHCSHNVFIDQQSLFIAAMKNWQ